MCNVFLLLVAVVFSRFPNKSL